MCLKHKKTLCFCEFNEVLSAFLQCLRDILKLMLIFRYCFASMDFVVEVKGFCDKNFLCILSVRASLLTVSRIVFAAILWTSWNYRFVNAKFHRRRQFLIKTL